MARIAGVNIPTGKRVEVALTYIHGIGRTKAREIREKVNIPEDRRVNELTDQEVIQIREVIDRVLSADMFRKRYADVFAGGKEWKAVKVT